MSCMTPMEKQPGLRRTPVGAVTTNRWIDPAFIREIIVKHRATEDEDSETEVLFARELGGDPPTPVTKPDSTGTTPTQWMSQQFNSVTMRSHFTQKDVFFRCPYKRCKLYVRSGFIQCPFCEGQYEPRQPEAESESTGRRDEAPSVGGSPTTGPASSGSGGVRSSVGGPPTVIAGSST